MIFPIKSKLVVKVPRESDYEQGESANELLYDEKYHDGFIYDVVVLDTPEQRLVNSGYDKDNNPLHSETFVSNSGVYFLFAMKTDKGYKMSVVDVYDVLIDDKDMNEYVKSRWQKM